MKAVWIPVALLCACSSPTDADIDVGADVGQADVAVDATVETDLATESDMPVGRTFETFHNVSCQMATEGFVRIAHQNEQVDGSFQFVVFSPTRDRVTISEVRLPDGSILNLFGLNEFQVRSERSVAAFTIPGLESLRDQFMAGEYNFRVTASGEVCHYVAENPSLGTTFDLNLYFATARLTAETAQTDPDFQDALDRSRTYFAQGGITLGDVTYRDVDPSIKQGFHVLESEEECEDLLSRSVRPDSEPQARGVNLFLVDALTWVSATGSVHGIPGPAGLHGSVLSGAVTSLKTLGEVDVPLNSGGVADGNELLAIFLSHEIGHFFGLRHTSETDLRVFDPLSDTPECSGPFDVLMCEDWENLMFPGTLRPATLSPQQVEMIRLHPSVR